MPSLDFMWLNSYLLSLFIGLASPEISESSPCAYSGRSPDSSRLRGNGYSKMNLFDLNITDTTDKCSKVKTSAFSPFSS